MEIVIVTEGMDGLTRERWEFWIRSEHSDSCIWLVLDRYVSSSRETKRHGWKPLAIWDRLDSRVSNIKDVAQVPMGDMLGQAVLPRALEVAKSKIVFAVKGTSGTYEQAREAEQREAALGKS